MTEPTPKRKAGRPPRGTSTMRKHLGIRFTDEDWANLEALAADSNERAVEAGLEPTYTPFGMVRSWIERRLAEEVAAMHERRTKAKRRR